MEIGQNFEYDEDWFGNWYLISVDEIPILTGVLPDAPAYSTLTPHIGSAIIKVNGVEVRNVEEILGEMEKIRPGSAVSLTFYSDGTESKVSISSKLLTSAELESIGRFVLDQNADVEVNYNDIMLALTPVNTENFYTFKKRWSLWD